jgi:hypothetical protein
MGTMTELLKHAIEKTKSLSAHRQDEVGQMLLDLVEQDASGLRLSDAQQAEVRRRLANPMTFATEHEKQDFFAKFA